MKKLSIACYLLVAVGVSSCLRDKDAVLDPKNTDNVIELYNVGHIESPGTSPIALYINSFDVAPEVGFDLIVSYSGAKTAPENITVNLQVDPEVLTTYNNINKTTFTLLPSDMFSMPLSVTIPKGEQRAIVSLKLKTNKFDFSKTYAIPVKIVSASYGIISGNFGKAVYRVGAKNKYDGVYTLKSKMVPPADRPTFSANPWTWGYEVQLVSTGANSVALYNSAYSTDYTHPIVLTDNSVSRLGSFTPEFIFDEATNKLASVKNYIANASNGRTGVINGTVTTSRYDPETKTVYAAFIMDQPAMASLPFYDTLIYKKPR